MPVYELEVAKSVEKDFKKISRDMRSQIFVAIEELASNPFPESKYKKLKGTVNSFRLRVGNYRILYDVDGRSMIITIYRVRHRKDVYKH